jgi:hypothetical protein
MQDINWDAKKKCTFKSPHYSAIMHLFNSKLFLKTKIKRVSPWYVMNVSKDENITQPLGWNWLKHIS